MEYGTSDWARYYPQFQRATGISIREYPTFWVEGTSRYTTYTQLGAMGIAIEAEGIIVWALKTIAQFLFGRIKKRLRPAPDRGGGVNVPDIPQDLGDSQLLPKDEIQKPFQRTPADTEVPSWHGVRVIILVKKKLDGLKGRVAGRVLDLAHGPIQRNIENVTGGRAKVEFVTQRKFPKRFLRIACAAGVDPDPVEAVVLVPKFVKGLVKGLVTRKIEQAVSDRLPDLKVDVIFQRTSARDFHDVEAAADSRESELLQGDPVSVERKPDEDSVKPKLEKSATNQDEENWLQWVIASLLTLLSVGNVWDRLKPSKSKIQTNHTTQ